MLSIDNEIIKPIMEFVPRWYDVTRFVELENAVRKILFLLPSKVRYFYNESEVTIP